MLRQATIPTAMVIGALAMLLAGVAAGYPPSGSRERADDLNEQEQALVALIEHSVVQIRSVESDLHQMDEQDWLKAYEEVYAEYIEKLIEFEQANRGTRAGLMAVRKLVHASGATIDPNNVQSKGGKYGINAAVHYASHELLSDLLRSATSGTTVHWAETPLRAIFESPEATETNRVIARYMLGRWALASRDGREYAQTRLMELEQGAEPHFQMERQVLSASFSRYPSPERLEELEQEAIAILESLAASDLSARQPAVAPTGGSWHILRIDDQASENMPLVRDRAAGQLFKERHLRVGQPAPDLRVTLFSGEPWALTDQRGKAVVIQFSFKGCGPCERMYPDLRALQREYEDGLVILSIMADADPLDTRQVIESGAITWNVHYDGRNGPLATQWSVVGFPTVYIVDQEGKIASQDRDVRDVVERLLK